MSENKPQIRKICTILEETFADGTVRLDTPTRKAAAAAVFVNPYGPQLYIHVLTFARNPNLADLTEWQLLSVFI